MKSFIVCLLLATSVLSSSVESIDQTDFYKKFGTIDGGIESGWVTVDGIAPHATDKDVNKFFYQLFYMKGKSKDTVDPADPIVIWLNGGPGNFTASHNISRLLLLTGTLH
jgi:carboxypeptidase C (cathepsin A)